MAPKFNLETADVGMLRERVKQLTTALVKQKEVIERLRGTEEKLAGDKEKLEKQVRNLQEEGEMSRTMRAELQGEVARLQDELELRSTELDMLHKKHEATGGANGDSASGDHDTVDALHEELHRVEAENRQLTQQVARFKGEADVAREQLTAMESRHQRFVTKRETSMRDGQEPEDENDAQESGDGAATNPDGEASTVNGGANGAGDGVRRSDESAHAEGRELELIKALAAARQLNIDTDTNLIDVKGQLQQAQAAVGRMEKAKSATETKVTALQAALETAQVGFGQAKKRIAELEAGNEMLTKQMASLKEAAADNHLKRAQIHTEKTEEVVNLQTEVERLKYAVEERERELGKARSRSEGHDEYARSLQAKLEALSDALSEADAALANERKQKEEAQRDGRKQQEAAQQAVADAAARVAHMKEEVERQLAMDKQIVKRLQAESKAKVSSLETLLSESQALVKEKEEQIARLTAEAAQQSRGGRDARSNSGGHGAAATLAITPLATRGMGGSDIDDAELSSMAVPLHTISSMEGEGGPTEGAMQEALAAVEELIEALSSDPSTAKAVARELADLEGCLGDPLSQSLLSARAGSARAQLQGAVWPLSHRLQPPPAPASRIIDETRKRHFRSIHAGCVAMCLDLAGHSSGCEGLLSVRVSKCQPASERILVGCQQSGRR